MALKKGEVAKLRSQLAAEKKLCQEVILAAKGWEEIAFGREQDKERLKKELDEALDRCNDRIIMTKTDAYEIRRLVVEIQGVSAKETDPDVKIEARNQFREELDSAYEDLKGEILRDATSAIIGKCEEISKKILVTGDKITEATLKTPKRIIDDYLNIAAIFDLNEVKSEVERLQSVVDGASAKSIRDNAAIAENFAMGMKTIGEKIGDLTGINAEGRQIRKVDLD